MSKLENIETLFKETFDRFEADVNPSVWTGVQKNISSVPVSAGKFSIGKIIGSIGLIAIGIAGTSIWNLLADKKQNGPTQQTPTIAHSEKIISEPLKNNPQILSPAKHPIQVKEETSNKLINTPKKDDIIVLPENNNTVEDNKTVVETTELATNMNKTAESNNTPEPSGPPMPGFSGLMRGNKPYNPSAQKPEYYSAPVANIFANTTSGDAPLTVELINNGIASSMNWNFGDGSSSNENSPSHTFTKTGVYTIILTAKTSLGNATDKITVEVKQVSEILNAPNIFTPNDDGENDVLYFEMKNISSIGVVIFSQKQGVVYDWNTLDGSWNGKLKNGSDAPEGAYFYTVHAIGSDGVSHSKKGNVFLKRQ